MRPANALRREFRHRAHAPPDSGTVRRSYAADKVTVSHHGLAIWPSRARRNQNRKPGSHKNQSGENFAVLEGSRLPIRIQSHANTGASAIMKIELND